MTDDELSKWVCDLIDRCAPESDELDYKATLSIARRTDRIELAKDISSFANERGGTILYGVPEDDSGEVPIPKELSACGMEIAPGLPERVEDILTETVDPPLPECVVRALSIRDAREKQVLLVYHPASWSRPHMTLYKDARYYRRGNFRAVLMTEREVEAAYAARRATMTSARDFFTGGDFGAIPDEGVFIRVIVCPHFALVRRAVMREREFRIWLASNPPAGRRGQWVPFLDGWRFPSYAPGAFHGCEFEVRLFHSGAMACTADMNEVVLTPDALMLPDVEEFLSHFGACSGPSRTPIPAHAGHPFRSMSDTDSGHLGHPGALTNAG